MVILWKYIVQSLDIFTFYGFNIKLLVFGNKKPCPTATRRWSHDWGRLESCLQIKHVTFKNIKSEKGL